MCKSYRLAQVEVKNSKMGEKKVNIIDVIDLLPNDTSDIKRPDVFYKNFIGWNQILNEQLERLEKLGRISTTIESREIKLMSHDYWDLEAVIDFAEYPYYACDLYKSKEGDCYYLVYNEYGGHAPETRCRLVQRRLMKIL
jgi:hypothetical protein